MSPELRLALIFGLGALAGAFGAIWRVRNGRARSVADGTRVDLVDFGISKLGHRITFLQLSSETCSACRQTARVLKELEQASGDTAHIEFDITNRLDLAKKYRVLQTPTTLVLDATGRVLSRIAGTPKPNTFIGDFVI